MIDEVIINENEVGLLREKNIEIFKATGPKVQNFPIDAKIQIHKKARIEALTRHPGPMRMLNLGAFSYCVSARPNLHKMWAGRFSSIAREVDVFDGSHPLMSASSSPFSYSDYYREKLPQEFRHIGPRNATDTSYGPVRIGNDVWIGAGVWIKAGVTIGDGAVIAARSVVVKDVPPYAIMGGNPAKVIKSRFDDELIQRLMAVKWWNIPIAELRKLDFRDPEQFVTECEAIRRAGIEDAVYTTLGVNAGRFEEIPSDTPKPVVVS